MLSLTAFSLPPPQDNAFVFPFYCDGKPLTEAFCLLSAKSAGSMSVKNTERREEFLRGRGIDPASVYACLQTHSRAVAVVEDAPAPRVPFPNMDGLVMRGAGRGGAFLTVTVGDCLPVYVFDTETGGFGLVHSGWKGTGIVLKAVEALGARAEAVCAVLGPCICGACYHVSEERRRVFAEMFSGGAFPLGAAVKGDCLDLRAANVSLLANAGVRNIAYCENCTFEDERLGSFRREGTGFTSMMALVGRGQAAAPVSRRLGVGQDAERLIPPKGVTNRFAPFLPRI